MRRLRDRERVGPRLADDPQPDRRIPVEPEGGVGVFRTLLDAGDVAQPHQMAVGAAADDQLGEILSGPERAIDAQSDVLLLRFEPAGGQLDILAPQGALDVGGGEAEGGEPLGAHPHPHRRARLAADEHPGDAVQ